MRAEAFNRCRVEQGEARGGPRVGCRSEEWGLGAEGLGWGCYRGEADWAGLDSVGWGGGGGVEVSRAREKREGVVDAEEEGERGGGRGGGEYETGFWMGWEGANAGLKGAWSRRGGG